jgi:hypothetical protein
MALIVDYDPRASEIVIHTPQGIILINECQSPHITRIVLLPKSGGYVSTSEGSPAIMTMWGAPVIVEPAVGDEDTEPMTALFEEDLEGQGK